MSEWLDPSIAPHNRPVIVITQRGRIFKAKIADIGDAEFNWSWATAEEDDPVPNCWTDGVCWDVNGDEERSDWPVGWMDIPAVTRSPSAPHTDANDTGGK